MEKKENKMRKLKDPNFSLCFLFSYTKLLTQTQSKSLPQLERFNEPKGSFLGQRHERILINDIHQLMENLNSQCLLQILFH